MPTTIQIRMALLTAALAAGPAGAAAGRAPESLEPFLDYHCYECHDDASRKGDLDLTGLA
ncbi:MAG: hypothetical protein HKN82_18235, partial [Akkermansiaceae bacterium]|nr:hypothetical protein [Akkermansiaceae bacterium]